MGYPWIVLFILSLSVLHCQDEPHDEVRALRLEIAEIQAQLSQKQAEMQSKYAALVAEAGTYHDPWIDARLNSVVSTPSTHALFQRLPTVEECDNRVHHVECSNITDKATCDHNRGHCEWQKDTCEQLEEEEPPPYDLFFIILAFGFGAFSRRVLKFSKIPYTVLMFLFGMAMGQLDAWVGNHVPHFSTAIANMNPELMLYLFLPVLIFESAFGMNVKTFGTVFPQVVLLAGPGLIICTALTGLFLKVALYSTWTWIKAFLFGALLSATDPVAVVALLKDLGAAESISTLIEGESLLNDGAAIVVFNILNAGLITNRIAGAGWIVLEFFRLAAGGPVFGWVLGRILTYSFKFTFNEAMVEVTMTFSLAYFTFYVSEGVLGVSGVLALVTYGVVLSARRAAISPEVEHFMHEFWEIAVYLANTLIFVLVGVQTRAAITDKAITGYDWLKLLALYAILNVSRFLMIACFYPLLNLFQVKLSWKESLLVGWGGLRGAVGLALALNVRINPLLKEVDPVYGALVGFHTAGIVLLTVLVNGVTTQKLVAVLNLAEVSTYHKHIMQRMYNALRRELKKSIRVLQTDGVIADAHWAKVTANTLGKLSDPYNGDTNEVIVCDAHEKANKAVVEMFKLEVWKLYEQGIAQQTTIRALVDYADTLLQEGVALSSDLLIQQYLNADGAKSFIANIAVFVEQRVMDDFIYHAYDLGNTFIQATTIVKDSLDTLLSNPILVEEYRDLLSECIEAIKCKIQPMAGTAPEITMSIKTRHAGRMVLNQGRIFLREMVEEGMVDKVGGNILIGQVEKAMENLKKLGRRMAVPNPEAVLKLTTWFALLPQPLQEQLLNCEILEAQEGTVMVGLGAVMDGLGVVVQGVIRVEDSKNHMDCLGPGRAFGVYGVLTGDPSLEKVSAQVPIRYFWFPKKVIRPILQSSPEFMTEMWRTRGTRLAAHMLESQLPYAVWGYARTLEHCEDGWVLHTNCDESICLWPRYEYVLLYGTAVYIDNTKVTAPSLIEVGISPNHNHRYLLTTERRKVLQNAFTMYDTDNSGEIDEQEFSQTLTHMGFTFTHAETSMLFAETDVDRSGTIDFSEFVHLIQRMTITFACQSHVLVIPRQKQVETDECGVIYNNAPKDPPKPTDIYGDGINTQILNGVRSTTTLLPSATTKKYLEAKGGLAELSEPWMLNADNGHNKGHHLMGGVDDNSLRLDVIPTKEEAPHLYVGNYLNPIVQATDVYKSHHNHHQLKSHKKSTTKHSKHKKKESSHNSNKKNSKHSKKKKHSNKKDNNGHKHNKQEHHPTPPHPMTHPQPRVAPDVDEEDPFGTEFGDISLGLAHLNSSNTYALL